VRNIGGAVASIVNTAANLAEYLRDIVDCGSLLDIMPTCALPRAEMRTRLVAESKRMKSCIYERDTVADNRRLLQAWLTGEAPTVGKWKNRKFQKLIAGASVQETALFDTMKVVAGAWKKRWNLRSIALAFVDIQAMCQQVVTVWDAAVANEAPAVRTVVTNSDWSYSWLQGSRRFSVQIGSMMALVKTLATTSKVLPTMPVPEHQRVALVAIYMRGSGISSVR
jgi:hypothetical protein